MKVHLDGARIANAAASLDVPMRTFMASDVQVRITFVNPVGLQVVVGSEGARLERRAPGAAWAPSACDGLAAAAGKILEVRIPVGCLGLPAGTIIAFVVAVDRGGLETEHYPPLMPIELELPG